MGCRPTVQAQPWVCSGEFCFFVFFYGFADPRHRLGLLIAEEGIWSLGFLFLVWQIGVFAEKWSKRVGGSGRETQPWVIVICWRRGMLSGAVGCC
jgi:hypothetical protein